MFLSVCFVAATFVMDYFLDEEGRNMVGGGITVIRTIFARGESSDRLWLAMDHVYYLSHQFKC